MVTAHRWQQIERILADCWDLPADERDRFLESRCRPDLDLLAEVRRFYLADSTADRWHLSTSAREFGTRLGPYELERLIGRGGMGAVYLAHRADGEFQQQVAIKMIGMPFESAEMRERFRRERQILAGLNHPNITRLLDGSATDEGQLYLVMEYVDGVPIHQFRAPADKKLELFRTVCAAVQYAHQNLVVHRDIKPSNILVSGEGVPKLLDFGAAKLLENSDATLTSFGMATVAYASPEQLRGEPASTLSDVFSLGAVLYEFLSGVKPFDGNVTSRLLACESNTVKLPVPLPGDLDNVVRKALAMAPADRYQSVEQLAEDVRRYQAGEAVMAHPPSLGYRAKRFVRRRWLAVASAAVFLLSLATAAAIAIQQARTARSEAVKAQTQALAAQREVARQKKLTNFLEEMLAPQGPYGGDLPMSQMLENVSPLLSKTFQDDPATEASLRMNLGASFTMMQRPERAKQEMDQALKAFRIAGDSKGQVVVLWLLGQTVMVQGRIVETISYYQQALDLVTDPQTKANPIWAFRVKRDLARALLLTADHNSRQDRERQRHLLEEAIAIADANPSISRVPDLQAAVCGLAQVLLRDGRTAAAEQQLSRAEFLWRGHKHDDGYANVLITRASLAAQRRDFRMAADAAREMAVIPQPEWVLKVGLRLWWARFRAEFGQTAQAVSEVHARLPELLNRKDEGFLSQPLSSAAHIMLCARRYAEAERYARAILRILDADHREPLDADRADAEELLGSALAGEGHYKEADALLRSSEQAYRASGEGSRLLPIMRPPCARLGSQCCPEYG